MIYPRNDDDTIDLLVKLDCRTSIRALIYQVRTRQYKNITELARWKIDDNDGVQLEKATLQNRTDSLADYPSLKFAIRCGMSVCSN